MLDIAANWLIVVFIGAIASMIIFLLATAVVCRCITGALPKDPAARVEILLTTLCTMVGFQCLCLFGFVFWQVVKAHYGIESLK